MDEILFQVRLSNGKLVGWERFFEGSWQYRLIDGNKWINGVVNVHLGIRKRFTRSLDQNEDNVFEGHKIRMTHWYFDGNEAETHLIGIVTWLPQFASFGLSDISNKEWLRHIGHTGEGTVSETFASWNFTQDDIEIIDHLTD
jgi:hypothetical protein